MTDKQAGMPREEYTISLYPRAAAMFVLLRPYLARLLEGAPAFGSVELSVTLNRDYVTAVETRGTVKMKPDRVYVESEVINGQ